MNATSRAWIGALRLRTLPLAAGGIILGSFLPEVRSAGHDWFWWLFILALLTAFGLQILSNLANDYGDFLKGTDNENRVGPQRAMQSGLISKSAMKKALIFTGILTFLMGIGLLWLAFGLKHMGAFLLMLAIGLGGIWAAIRYTVGKRPYGYAGFGDVFVVLFFGLVAVWGVSFLYLQEWNSLILLPALSYGFLSAGVLNINNMRDIENDEASGKFTLVVKIGPKRSRIYHALLMALAFLTTCAYLFLGKLTPIHYLALFSFVPIAINAAQVLRRKKTPAEYGPFLKGLAIGSLIQVVLFVLIINML